jgi:hypothetical protein
MLLLLGGLLAAGAAAAPTTGPSSLRGNVPVGNEGWWGPMTSSVDWCELNYMVTVFVAEWWNTLSSLAMIAVGLAGFVLHRNVLERRFLFAYLMVSTLGAGSVLFHATLHHWGQMLDELPMLYAAAATTFILLENKASPQYVECVNHDRERQNASGTAPRPHHNATSYPLTPVPPPVHTTRPTPHVPFPATLSHSLALSLSLSHTHTHTHTHTRR